MPLSAGSPPAASLRSVPPIVVLSITVVVLYLFRQAYQAIVVASVFYRELGNPQSPQTGAVMNTDWERMDGLAEDLPGWFYIKRASVG